MTTKNRVLCVVALVAVVLVGAQVRAGAVINVDFENNPANSASVTQSGQGAIAATGDIWNSVKNGAEPTHYYWGDYLGVGSISSGALVDSQGNATGSWGNPTTGVTVSLTNLAGVYSWTGYNPGTPPPVLANCTSHPGLMNDWAIEASTPGVATISGLTAGKRYDLAVYGHSHEVGGNTTFSIGGVEKTTADGTVPHSLTAGLDYVNYNGVAANGAGQIPVSFWNGPGVKSGGFNGFQITVASLISDANLLSGHTPLVSTSYQNDPNNNEGRPGNLTNGHGGGPNGDFIFQPGDDHQRAVINDINSAVSLIRIWSGNDLFPGQVTIKSSTTPGLGLDGTFETALGCWAYSDTISTWTDSGTTDLDAMELYYKDIVVSAPAGTKSLLIDFGDARTSGPNPTWNASRISEIQAFAPVPEPGTLILLTAGMLSLLVYAWRKRK